MLKVIILIDNGFEEAELLYCFYRLQEAGYSVELVGEKAGREYAGDHGYLFKSTMSVDDVNIKDYKAVIIPGGSAPDIMRAKEALVALVRDAVDEGLVVGAICHGPQLLIEANVLRARRATCHLSIRTDLINAGASYEDLSVVSDGNIITAQEKESLPEFMKETIKALERSQMQNHEPIQDHLWYGKDSVGFKGKQAMESRSH